MTARQQLIEATANYMHELGIQQVMDEDMSAYIGDTLYLSELGENARTYYVNLTSIRAIVRLYSAIQRAFMATA